MLSKALVFEERIVLAVDIQFFCYYLVCRVGLRVLSRFEIYPNQGPPPTE